MSEDDDTNSSSILHIVNNIKGDEHADVRSTLVSADPDDYTLFTDKVKTLGPIQNVYSEALSRKELEERVYDEHYLERSNEFKTLHNQISSSYQVLDSLYDHLSKLQKDLTFVSGHLTDLQTRNREIEKRITSREDLLSSLDPLLQNTALDPNLIHIIMDTSPSETWISAIAELDERLTAIKTGPRVSNRIALDNASEHLRLKAASKIRDFFISQLQPFGISVSSNLQLFQTSVLMKYRPLFQFLQRHAAKTAHEVQKLYITTTRWYYETGFRRYVRALGNVKLQPQSFIEDDQASTQNFAPTKERIFTGLEHSKIAGVNVILAFQTNTKAFTQPIENVFRSISLVLMDNAFNEWSFLSSFFTPFESMENENVTSRTSVSEASSSEHKRKDSTTSDSSSVNQDNQVNKESWKKNITQNIWKQIMEPSLEYAKNFSFTLIDDNATMSSPVSLLTMIRLNDAIFKKAIDLQECPAGPMEHHLLSIKLRLWPMFQKSMNSLIDGNKASVGLFGQRTSSKDVSLSSFARNYIILFCALIALLDEQDEEMIFSGLSRARTELHNILDQHVSKITDPSKRSVFLMAFYDEMLQGLTAGSSSHLRSQSEISHWRELRRKVR